MRGPDIPWIGSPSPGRFARSPSQDSMSLGCPRDGMNPRLDLDGTLKTWPAPTRAESFWEERAHAIVRAALTENTNTKLLDALMRAPPLPGEPGDPSAAGA